MRHGPKDQIITHIGFAERWLSRAKAECRDGNVARGLLTLLLAEAEVHHARVATSTDPNKQLPSTGPADAKRRRSASRGRRRLSAFAAVVGATAGGIVALSLWAGVPQADEAGGVATAPAIVRLGHQVGSVLELVPSPAPGTMDPARASATDGPAEEDLAAGGLSPGVIPHQAGKSPGTIAAGGGVRSRPASSVRPAASTRVAPRAASRRPAAGNIQPAASPLLSDGELIELVLAAERSLRSGSR